MRRTVVTLLAAGTFGVAGADTRETTSSTTVVREPRKVATVRERATRRA